MLVATKILSRVSLGRCAPSTAAASTALSRTTRNRTSKPKNTIQIRCLSTTRPLDIQKTLLRLAKKNVVVPPLAESLSEGDVKFEKNVGDVVIEDDLIASIETDKTSIPVNSPFAGKIVELLVEDSSTVKPGQIILVIDTEAGGDASSAKSEAANASAPPPPTSTSSSTESSKPSPPAQPTPTPSAPASAPASPSKPAFAQQKSSVSVETVKSELDSLTKGQFGNDVHQQRSVTAVKMNRMRMKIASRLKDAQNSYAMLTTFNEIDMSNLIEMRQKYKDSFLKKHSVKLGFMSAFVKASAYALKDQPVVNAVIDGNHMLYRDFIDISVAVATPKGLVVPVLRNVEHMNFADIEKTINQLGEKAKNNALTVADMEGGTFTISNGGVFGSLFGTPIINPPQSAILGMHAINDKPAAVNGQVVIRPIMVVALTYDHRLIDGREAVTFLKKIKEVIEDPRVILLDL